MAFWVACPLGLSYLRVCSEGFRWEDLMIQVGNFVLMAIQLCLEIPSAKGFKCSSTLLLRGMRQYLYNKLSFGEIFALKILFMLGLTISL